SLLSMATETGTSAPSSASASSASLNGQPQGRELSPDAHFSGGFGRWIGRVNTRPPFWASVPLAIHIGPGVAAVAEMNNDKNDASKRMGLWAAAVKAASTALFQFPSKASSKPSARSPPRSQK